MTVRTVSQFGRTLESWEVDKAAFIERGKDTLSDGMELGIYQLSSEEFERVVSVCDPRTDRLTRKTTEEFTVVYPDGSTTVYAF